ncbi:hypothetical protein [Cupriavidus necator]
MVIARSDGVATVSGLASGPALVQLRARAKNGIRRYINALKGNRARAAIWLPLSRGLVIAGGIGNTPLLSMARTYVHLASLPRFPYKLHISQWHALANFRALAASRRPHRRSHSMRIARVITLLSLIFSLSGCIVLPGGSDGRNPDGGLGGPGGWNMPGRE